MLRAISRYFLMVTLPLIGILAVLWVGQGLTPLSAAIGTRAAVPEITGGAIVTFNLTTLLVQIGVVLVTARTLGWLFRRFHQPQVIGEMIAGILLGPSLLGWVAPRISAAVFPLESLGFLNAVSQIGLIVFMFLVGLELNPKIVQGRGHTAVATSHVSILVPFFLGTLLALFLYPRLSDPRVTFTGFALFMGVSMSITAFPVLARILTERQMLHTQVGAIAIACAAVDDVTAWCILAAVVLITRASSTTVPLAFTLAGSAAFFVFMIVGARRWLRRLAEAYQRSGQITQDLLGLVLLLVLGSALVTEALGVHALFGAFLLGAVMPKEDRFVQSLTEKIESLVVVLLLPLYFAFTGLRMSVSLLNGYDMLLYLGLILIVAILGKFGGAAITARLTGLPWREAGAIGILMNTRGLVELVALNIGLDLGIISPALFTLMVLMAVITTFMTTPVLNWIYPSPLWRQAPLTTARSRGVGAETK